jgi:hypothetical protein
LLALLGGALSMSLFYVLQKPIVKKYPAVSITAWSYFSGAMSMGLACLYVVGALSWEGGLTRGVLKERKQVSLPQNANTSITPLRLLSTLTSC